jgi:hypothetical protein
MELSGRKLSSHSIICLDLVLSTFLLLCLITHQDMKNAMSRSFRSLLVLSLFIIFSFPAAVFSADSDAGTEPEKRLITVDDQFALKSVGSPVFSPDGKSIA